MIHTFHPGRLPLEMTFAEIGGHWKSGMRRGGREGGVKGLIDSFIWILIDYYLDPSSAWIHQVLLTLPPFHVQIRNRGSIFTLPDLIGLKQHHRFTS